MFPGRENTAYRQVQRGAKVRDLSSGAFTSAVWNDNAAQIIMDYLTHEDGLRLDDSWILNAVDHWQQAINDCNENIPLDAGGNEDRYLIWGTYTFDERPADVLERMLAACDGYLFSTETGGIGLKVGKWAAPTVTLDDSAIIAFSDIGRGRDILTTANTIRATFTYPDYDYRETDAQPWVDAADVTARGEYSTDREFLMVPSHTQCRRLMKIAAHRANPNWTGTFTTNLRGLAVLGERFINIDFPLLGINESFEVLGVQFLIEGTVLQGLTINVASLSSAAYAWDENTEEGNPPVVPDDIPRAA
jgi:hypothetical protein